MERKSTFARLLDRIGSDAAAGPLTPLLDEHLAQVSGGCGCGHSSSSNHRSSGSGPNHRSQTTTQQAQ